MRKHEVRCVLALTLALTASRANAQMFETVGIRAKGMGGAFVAVANDATATWWNPAGLATGRLLSLTGERDQATIPTDPAIGEAARQDTAVGFSFAYPGLGLGFYRIRVTEIAPHPSTDPTDPDRQDPEAAEVTLRELAISQYGVTLGQSLGNHFVLGTTLKLMRGGISRAAVVGTAGVDEVGDLFGLAGDLDVKSESSTDIDIGAMAAFGRIRFGATLKHAKAASFGVGEDRYELPRQARAGFAFLAQTGGLVKALTVSADADLLTTDTVRGEVRRMAAGAEASTGGHLTVRGGVNFDTVGSAETTGSVGVSAGIAGGISLDSAFIFGPDRTRNGFSAGFSVTF